MEQLQQPSGEERATVPKKRVTKKVSEEAISPHPSYWPLALAAALVVALMGTITHPVVLGIGVVLVIIAIVGWGLERR